ncbi:hypothetical protein PICMEDRAFT_157117 [Pichia membranifaciens NRRL Y-2026]|uniref:PCI domain-containing protein n=1 Tax=Pichia membranifaciens NRRL Y-2026 TaxID=763406 RepID=A0A1E3NFS1_9ASCO|nr:hypothetical protein PICMEDRAFT_157117 [Pichia membranifaciens NRRL Y-2026]ODQ44936.1 hypothetical protein PICMEDRAFT_157117 [Pichia membranifaciens NRRL Y-2026]
MAFTIVIDNDLHFSLLELAAILDLELKSQDHHYKPLFQKLLDENKTAEIVQQLAEVQKYFLRSFSKKSFEPSVNLYIHIVNLVAGEGSAGRATQIELLSGLRAHIDPHSPENADVLSSLEVPVDVILVCLTNIFNSLPVSSAARVDALAAIVAIVVSKNVSGTIGNIAKHTVEWLSSVEGADAAKVSGLVTAIFNQYAAEDEQNAIRFLQGVIASNKIPLDSAALVNFFANLLSSTDIYDISKYENAFDSTSDASFSKLLKLYVTGDNKSYSAAKQEFLSASFASQINFANLDSNFQSLAILNYLASSVSDSNTFSYNTIAQDLGISIDDVELKLITLISQGLIAAKLSQSTGSVVLNSINYSAPSLSTKTELVNWNEIDTLLGSWSENVANLQSIVQTLIVKRGKRVNAPPVIMSFHQQKLEAKEAREKKAQQANNSEASTATTDTAETVASFDGAETEAEAEKVEAA